MARKKTLKSRMRKVIYTSIILTIMLFFVVLSVASLSAEQRKGHLLTSMISHLAATNVFRDERPGTDDQAAIQELVNHARELESKSLRTFVMPDEPGYSVSLPENYNIKGLPHLKEFIEHPLTKDYYKLGDVTQMRIEVNGKEIYKSSSFGDTRILREYQGQFFYPAMEALTNLLDSQSRYYLDGSSGEAEAPYAIITVRLDPTYLVTYFLFLRAGSLLIILIGFLLTGLLGRTLSNRIAKPFTLLEARVRSLALEDYETTLHSQIIVKKRPLAEISSIAESTNTILQKMQAFDDMMMEQKNQLEEQNTDLENQKEELLESKQMIQEAQSQLVQSQNLAAVGQLTAAISHEIDEPLENIQNSMQKQTALMEKLEKNEKIAQNEDLRDFVFQLRDASSLNHTALDRITSIIRSLRSFSRQDLDETEETPINESIQSVVLLTSNLWKRRIKIIEDYGAIPPVWGNPGLINQVFMNIVVNAIHAIPDKGDIAIKTWTDDAFVFVSITDTGTGIPDDILPHIFETGFTTKKCGTGSGLGLAICESIVHKHNGKIEVKSQVGTGTTFTVILPSHKL